MNEEKILGYINKIEDDRQSAIKDNEFRNSMTYKYRVLNNEKDKGYKQCLAKTFEKFYRNSIPLGDGYKMAHGSELNNDIDNFVKSRGADDLFYYVGEANRRGCKAATRIMESVQKIVDEAFEEQETNLKDCDVSDLVFKMDADMDKKIDATSKDMELDDLSKVISDNVKSTAISEIMRAKKEKEGAKALEKELADDITVTSEAAIQRELELRGLNQKKIFQPSLFEGIMIGKLNQASMLSESGVAPEYIYDALDMYGLNRDSSNYATPEEVAFVESVREYTMLNIVKALKLENFNNLSIVREMAQDYAGK